MSENYPQRHILIVANGINFIDITGAEFLVQEAHRWRSLGGGLYIVGLKLVAQDVLSAGSYRDEIGAENIFNTKRVAIEAIYQRLGPSVCATCPAKVFQECATRGE